MAVQAVTWTVVRDAWNAGSRPAVSPTPLLHWPSWSGEWGWQGALGVKQQLVWAHTSTLFPLCDLLRVIPSFPRYGSKNPPSKSTIWNPWCLCLEMLVKSPNLHCKPLLRAEHQRLDQGTNATERLPHNSLLPKQQQLGDAVYCGPRATSWALSN